MSSEITFRLIGNTTLFTGSRFINKAGIRCVLGKSKDGKKTTVARECDVVFVEGE